MTNSLKNACLLITLISLPALAGADALDEAFSLLRLTSIDQKFDATRRQQTRDIIRTYSLIVSEKSEVQLPQPVKNAISKCYEESYDFEKFRRGIAEILVNTFSEKELKLLVDYNSNLGLPPREITAFREIVAKADIVQSIGAEFILNNSTGCVQKGASLVMEFLASQRVPNS